MISFLYLSFTSCYYFHLVCPTFPIKNECYRDVFNDVLSTATTPQHCPKRERDRHSPRMQSRLASVSNSYNADFLSNGRQLKKWLRKHKFDVLDFLTRNTAVTSHHISEKQNKIYNALALASVNRWVRWNEEEIKFSLYICSKEENLRDVALSNLHINYSYDATCQSQ